MKDKATKFEWINDRPPTLEDADENGKVQIPHFFLGGHIDKEWDNYLVRYGGLPWVHSSSCEGFTRDDPAPIFYPRHHYKSYNKVSTY